MEHDQDPELPQVAGWSSAQVARLADVAEQVRAAARPQLAEFLHDESLLRMLGALSPEAPLWDLARGIAERALRRTLQDARRVEALRGRGDERLSQVGWQFVCNLAFAELTEDAVRELRTLRARRRAAHGWDG